MKNNHLIKKLCLSLICLSLISVSFSQTYVNKEWIKTSGTVGPITRTVTKYDHSDNIIIVGNVFNGAINKTDVLVTKYDHTGLLLWQKTYNGPSNGNDYGVQVEINSNDEIFVAATIDGGSTSGMDYGLLKYSSSGSLVMSRTWDGAANGIDIPADIKIDDNDNIYLVGGSQARNGLSDYEIVKYDSTGLFQWNTNYNFNDFHDAATSLTIENTLVVTGASATNSNEWDYATLQINMTNGAIINIERTSVPGLGFDNALDVASKNNNFYITGYSEVGGVKSIQTIKLDASFGLVWSQTFDAGMNDVGNSIAIDDNDNVYITGYSENGNGNGKDVITIKYDPLGNEMWQQRYGSGGNPTEAIGKQLVVPSDGGVIIAATIEENGNNNFATVKYNENGDMEFEEIFDNNNSDDVVESIIEDGEDIYITGISTVGTNKIITTIKYTYREKELTIITDANGNEFIDNNIIIRFDQNSLYRPKFNTTNITHGILSDFVKPQVLSAMEAKTGVEWGDFETFKVFYRMTTADSTSVTRMGDIIKSEDFWTTLSVVTNGNLNEEELVDSLNVLEQVIQYSQLDGVFRLNAIPNDFSLSYNFQTSLIPNATYPNAHINMNPAWDIEVGQNNVKVGVFDSEILWSHEDFGDGTFAGSKIVGGYDYRHNRTIASATNPASSHGTAVAGIIGALSNNTLGIAGIAGGDMVVDASGNTNSGVQLFSMGLFTSRVPTSDVFVSFSTAAAAIFEGAVHNPTTGFGYGLHIQNHSYGSTTDDQLVRSAVYTCWRNHCIFVASRGNDGNSSSKYPACYNDLHLLSVMASGNDGDLLWGTANGPTAHFSSYGLDADFMAPGSGDNVVAPYYTGAASTTYLGVCNVPSSASSWSTGKYTCFGGTSSAAPHVAGVAALMLSKHNTNNGAPNNLVTEDIENILQKTATDKRTAGYDQFTGWGLINAYDALKDVEYPRFYVKHKTSAPSQSITTNQTVAVLNRLPGVSTGTYIADRHELNWTIVEVLPTTDKIIDWWTVEAFTNRGFSAATAITGSPWMQITPSITIGSNVASVTATTNAWLIKTSIGGATVNKWVPAAPSELKYGYSLHCENTSLTSISEEKNENYVGIYPNPTSDKITVSLNLNKREAIFIQIIDANGKLIVNEDIGKLPAGNNNIIVNTANLSEGIYFCKIISKDNIITKKIIKNL